MKIKRLYLFGTAFAATTLILLAQQSADTPARNSATVSVAEFEALQRRVESLEQLLGQDQFRFRPQPGDVSIPARLEEVERKVKTDNGLQPMTRVPVGSEVGTLQRDTQQLEREVTAMDRRLQEVERTTRPMRGPDTNLRDLQREVETLSRDLRDLKREVDRLDRR